MPWGGSYSGMTLWGVSIVNLQGFTLPCGNGYCGDEGENCDTCPQDCISNDGGCGNGVCEPGEDCLSCPYDCAGNQVGKPSTRFCCGGGSGVNPVRCDDERCSSGGFSCGGTDDYYCCNDEVCEGAEDSFNCEIDCGPPPICGDGDCNPGEDKCICSEDCGTPPSTELGHCTDGFDNDCDGLIDCDDSDCSSNEACLCLPKGESCSSGDECCSGLCHPVKGVCK